MGVGTVWCKMGCDWENRRKGRNREIKVELFWINIVKGRDGKILLHNTLPEVEQFIIIIIIIIIIILGPYYFIVA